MLQGCAIVVVQTAAQKPRLSAWPFGVRVERGGDDAISVDSTTLGLITGCGMLGIGFQRCDQIRIDARTCGVAIIEKPDPRDRKLLSRVADQARASCLHETPNKEARP